MKKPMHRNGRCSLIATTTFACVTAGCTVGNHLRLDWGDEVLVISGSRLAVPVKVEYLEAFVRSGSTNQHWRESKIPHRTTLIAQAKDRSSLVLRSELPLGPESGPASTDPPVVVEHYITAGADEVSFLVTARNRGTEVVDVLWAQPCISVGEFTGRGLKWYEEDHYLDACFIFLDGKLTTLDETPRHQSGSTLPGKSTHPSR